MANYPFLLATALASNPPGSPDSHPAGVAHLERIISRGQHGGDFDDELPASWLAAAIVELTRTAAGKVAADRVIASPETAMVLEGALRLCGARGPRRR